MQGYSIPETTRAYGAVLLNADREEFTDSLGPRDEVSQAIVDEVEAGRGVETPDGRPAVCLDTTRISEADAEISLPYMLRRYRAAGIDPLREPILTYPVLHYQNGGLVIDEHGETTLDGLYACGEIAGGTHGRNRMMGNSLLECCVFGRRAGSARGREGGRMSTVATDIQQAVEDAAAHLYVWALKDIPQDLRDALATRASARPRCPGSACSTRSSRTSRSPTTRRTSSARTPASPSTLPGRRALPAASGPDLRGAVATAPSARRSSTRCARTPSTR